MANHSKQKELIINNFKPISTLLPDNEGDICHIIHLWPTLPNYDVITYVVRSKKEFLDLENKIISICSQTDKRVEYPVYYAEFDTGYYSYSKAEKELPRRFFKHVANLNTFNISKILKLVPDLLEEALIDGLHDHKFDIACVYVFDYDYIEYMRKALITTPDNKIDKSRIIAEMRDFRKHVFIIDSKITDDIPAENFDVDRARIRFEKGLLLYGRAILSDGECDPYYDNSKVVVKHRIHSGNSSYFDIDKSRYLPTSLYD